MPTDVKVLIMIMACVALLCGFFFKITDDESWTKTEDSACYLHVKINRHLIAHTEVTRERYCKEAL